MITEKRMIELLATGTKANPNPSIVWWFHEKDRKQYTKVAAYSLYAGYKSDAVYVLCRFFNDDDDRCPSDRTRMVDLDDLYESKPVSAWEYLVNNSPINYSKGRVFDEHAWDNFENIYKSQLENIYPEGE